MTTTQMQTLTRHDRFNGQHTATTDMSKLREIVPSIFADKPSEHVSKRYQFVPTTRVMELLERDHWRPVWAAQSRCKDPEGKEFVKHMLRFRNDKIPVQIGDTLPELVMVNSHNAGCTYQLMAGLFRLVCGNGMIVAEANFASIRVRHTGFDQNEILSASEKVIDAVPLINNSVKRFQSIMLTVGEQMAYAKAAMKIRYDEEKPPFEANRLLEPRRAEDMQPNLWNTFNRVQENMMKGGVRYHRINEQGRVKRQRTRQINSVGANVSVNRALWTLADEMAKLKSN